MQRGQSACATAVRTVRRPRTHRPVARALGFACHEVSKRPGQQCPLLGAAVQLQRSRKHGWAGRWIEMLTRQMGPQVAVGTGEAEIRGPLPA